MPQIKASNLDLGSAAWIMAGIFSSWLFLGWLDTRHDNRISERIAPLEHRLNILESKMDSADMSRNRQYGELRGMLQELTK